MVLQLWGGHCTAKDLSRTRAELGDKLSLQGVRKGRGTTAYRGGCGKGSNETMVKGGTAETRILTSQQQCRKLKQGMLQGESTNFG